MCFSLKLLRAPDHCASISAMESILVELKGFGSFLLDLIKQVLSVVPKIVSFCLWVIAAVFILPCVFVAGALYPLWEKWGEDF